LQASPFHWLLLIAGHPFSVTAFHCWPALFIASDIFIGYFSLQASPFQWLLFIAGQPFHWPLFIAGQPFSLQATPFH